MFHDEENEQALLGACLRDYRNVVPKVMTYLSPEDFYGDFHREVFSAVLFLYSQQKTVNPTTVMTMLKRNGKEFALSLFTNLAENCISVTGFEEYASRIKDLSLRRQIWLSMQKLQEETNTESSIEQIVSLMGMKMNELIDASKGFSKRSRYLLRETLSEYAEEISKTAPEGLTVKRQVKTHFSIFDSIFGGLRKGSLIYIGGRPSMGKSTLMIQWSHNIAKNGGTVFVCSFEIGRIELQTKLVSLQADVSSGSIDKGPIDANLNSKIIEGCHKLYDLNYYYTDTAMSVQEIMLEAQQIKDTTGKLTAIFIDRIEIIKDKPFSGENRNLQLSRISASLNRMATEFDIPVVCLVQLSRQAARRGSTESHRPILSDFRDSGSIEQDAKMAVMVHREEMYSNKPEFKNKAELIVAKNMFGGTGFIEARFEKKIPAFFELDKREEEYGQPEPDESWYQ